MIDLAYKIGQVCYIVEEEECGNILVYSSDEDRYTLMMTAISV